MLLNIGCGAGRVARELAKHVGRVLCLDLSPEMLLYTSTKGLEAVNVDMRSIPLRSSSIDVAYSLLATVSHLESIGSLAQHLQEVHRVLRRGGVYIADLVLEEPPCTGVCDEWPVEYQGMRCTARHIVETTRDSSYTETLELDCNGETVVRSRATLLLPKARALLDKAASAGFSRVVFLKPYTLQATDKPTGRVFAVLVK